MIVDPRGFTELHKHEQVSCGPTPWVLQRQQAGLTRSWVLSVRFYAGGSERSGQQIVGPPRKKSPNELVEDLFKGAKEHGAVAVDRTAKSGGETSKPKVRRDEFFLLFPISVKAPPCQLFGTEESWDYLSS